MKHTVFKKSVLLVLCLLAALGLCGMAAAEETAPEQTRVEVFTVDEFLDAIAPNTEIILATGEYNLTRATGYSRSNSAYYHWEGGYDGYELVITDVENLSIVGGDPNAVTISTEPRYANVLRFDNVDGVTLSDLVVGHTREQGLLHRRRAVLRQLPQCGNPELPPLWLRHHGCAAIQLQGCPCGRFRNL